MANPSRVLARLDVRGPAETPDTALVALVAAITGVCSIFFSVKHHLVMLYRDAMGHLGMARLVSDHRVWSLRSLSPNWLPLPQLLMAPFAVNRQWWHSGLAAAIPSTLCFVLTILGVYRLARRLMPFGWALFAAAILCFNPNLLYLDTTPMSEPLAILLEVWIALATVEFVSTGPRERIARKLLWLGGLVFAADLTRYDGWVLGGALWCFVVWTLHARRTLKENLVPLLGFTLLAVLGPALWMLDSKIYWRSWLNFVTGEYSVRRDVLTIFPPGTQQYYGWHDPIAAFFLYLRTAQLMVAAREWGYAFTAASVVGSAFALRDRISRAALILWLPLPFHVYVLAAGALAMMLPDMGPFHAFMTIRYGAQLLPALAVFSALGLSALGERLRQRTPGVQRVLLPGASVALLTSSVLMLHDVPILLRDGLSNARPRLALVAALEAKFTQVAPNTPVMVDLWTTDTGMTLVQDASIPLRDTIGPYDGQVWDAAAQAPATQAGWVVAADGTPIATAVDAHPEHLRLVAKACDPRLHCVRLFQSEIYPSPR